MSALALAVAICSETAKYGGLPTGALPCFLRENDNLETFLFGYLSSSEYFLNYLKVLS